MSQKYQLQIARLRRDGVLLDAGIHGRAAKCEQDNKEESRECGEGYGSSARSGLEDLQCGLACFALTSLVACRCVEAKFSVIRGCD